MYGYNFDLSNVSIRNCLSNGLYTEWGNFGQPGPDKSMESRYYGLRSTATQTAGTTGARTTPAYSM